MPPPESQPGTYLITLESRSRQSITVGRNSVIKINPGYYCYVGSAFGPGGVLARVRRHCRISEHKHWHIDYLREATSPTCVWFNHSSTRREHRWAGALGQLPDAEPLHGLGCTDCDCPAHLYYFPAPPTPDDFARLAGCKVSTCCCEDLA